MSVPIHRFGLQSPLFMEIEVLGTNYRTAKPVMIFNPKGPVDTSMRLVNTKEGLTLDINLESSRVGKFGASRKICFYPSYLIMNLTEVPLQYRQFGSLGSDSQVKVSASGDMFTQSLNRSISRSVSTINSTFPFASSVLLTLFNAWTLVTQRKALELRRPPSCSRRPPLASSCSPAPSSLPCLTGWPLPNQMWASFFLTFSFLFLSFSTSPSSPQLYQGQME